MHKIGKPAKHTANTARLVDPDDADAAAAEVIFD